MIESLGPVEIKITKSEIAFKRKRGFAWAWMPGKYVLGSFSPLVLSLSLRRRDASPCWKEVVEPYPGRSMPHLELYSLSDLDDEIRGFLAEAWSEAG